MNTMLRRPWLIIGSMMGAGATGAALGLMLAVDWRADSPVIAGVRADLVPLQERLAGKRLTSEGARSALVEMLKTMKAQGVRNDGCSRLLASLDPARLAQLPMKRDAGGDWTLQGFRIDLKNATYSLECGHGCNFHYSGSFSRERGHWAASPLLHWDWVACRK
jgi:hypothetical protein